MLNILSHRAVCSFKIASCHRLDCHYYSLQSFGDYFYHSS